MATSALTHTIIQVVIVVGLMIFIVGFIGFALWEKFMKDPRGKTTALEHKGGK